jgi:hypothetical protein
MSAATHSWLKPVITIAGAQSRALRLVEFGHLATTDAGGPRPVHNGNQSRVKTQFLP